ncbi:MAG: MarR family transcriptional regulator [Alphaproteobacteria bacterium]|nr:MarR family transcriptional regulator [Alphaproteobacteria bacterium]
MRSDKVSPRERRPRRAAGHPETLYPLSFSIGAAIRLTHRQFAQLLQERLAPYDIPVGMWFFFRALWEEDGLTQRQLSQRVGSMEQTTVEQLKNMERRGYVERRRSLDDRRKIHVHLTASGCALKNRLLPFAREVNEIALAGLSDGEIGFLRLVLERIRGNLGAHLTRRRGASPDAGIVRHDK